MQHANAFVLRVLLTGLLIGLLTGHERPVQAQTPTVKQLDRDAERARIEYLKQLGSLATKYDEAGETERAKKVLRQILDLAPDIEEAQKRLDELEERVFTEQSLEIDVDVAKSWVPTGFVVEKDKPIRFEATGTYKFIVNSTLGPDGISTADLDHHLVPGINCGALMGLVATQPKAEGRDKPKPKPGTPFLIGAKSEKLPEATGMLYLRVNVPTGTTSNGKLKVKLSGHVRRVTPST